MLELTIPVPWVNIDERHLKPVKNAFSCRLYPILLAMSIGGWSKNTKWFVTERLKRQWDREATCQGRLEM